MEKAKAQAEAIHVISEALKAENATDAAKLAVAREVCYYSSNHFI